MAIHLLLSSSPKPPQNPNPNPTPKSISPKPSSNICFDASKRDLAIRAAALSLLSLTLTLTPPPSAISAAETSSSKSIFSGISNTKSWFRFFGDGFSIRVPPQFDDVMEPEVGWGVDFWGLTIKNDTSTGILIALRDATPFLPCSVPVNRMFTLIENIMENDHCVIDFNTLSEDYYTGLSYYGDKAKPKVFAARFASPDRSEVLSVVIRPSNQLKITFLEAKDIADLGSLKEAARIFVPGSATLYSARTFKIKEDEELRTYYFYEFSVDDQHVALVAAVNGGKAFIAGAAAPLSKWEDDGVKLRSAAISLSVL